jgi:hypothetical protein
MVSISVLSLVISYLGCLRVFLGDSELLKSKDFCWERGIDILASELITLFLFGRLL